MARLQMYCPNCKEFSFLKDKAIFTIWPGEDSIECPNCHKSYRVHVEFYTVASAAEFRADVEAGQAEKGDNT